ncbi:hypothetical protein SALCHL_001530 [Streptomyces albus subsp. chlorinus]|uniref:hypothetical protein n=1 Tax=Streptomyces albus TaxID=1888 RepID=UPI001FABD265
MSASPSISASSCAINVPASSPELMASASVSSHRSSCNCLVTRKTANMDGPGATPSRAVTRCPAP